MKIFDLEIEGRNYHPHILECLYPEFCQKYCRKEGDYITNIDRENRLKTSKEVKNELGRRIIAGESLPAIIIDYPEHILNYQRIYQSVTLFRLHSMRAIETSTCRGIWIHGPAGVGKSYFAREFCKQHNIQLFLKSQSKWFDGYQGQAAILLDDYDCGKALGHLLKIWTDCYATDGEIKGGTVPLMHVLFFVTSNYSIEDQFSDEIYNGAVKTDYEELRNALRRRFQTVHLKARH